MIYRRRAVALSLTMALLVQPAAAAADTATVNDPRGDVRTGESERAVSDPRVDITRLAVRHEASELRVAVSVERFTPLDDDVWMQSLQLDVALVDDDDQPWFWSFVPDGGGGAAGRLVSFTDDGVEVCETAATASAVRSEYVLTADASCLRALSPEVRVGAAMSFDSDRLDDDFDTPFDVAPDDDFTAPIGISGPAVTRLAGADRIATAVALSTDGFADGAAPAAVLVASGAEDAAPAGPLAASLGAPLLLTGGRHLDERVAGELQRAVEPGGEVLLVGGTGALAEALVTEVRGLGLRPRRVAGLDRFATAVAVAEHIGDHAVTLVADAWQPSESVVASAAAATLGGVVVLSDGGSLPAVTDDFLAHDAARHVAIGAAAAAAPGAERVTAGSTPELSQRVLDRLLPDVRTIAVVAVGAADALAGAPHLAARGGGLLLTEAAALSPAIEAELAQRAGALREVLLYGGTASLGQGIADAISAAVR